MKVSMSDFLFAKTHNMYLFGNWDLPTQNANFVNTLHIVYFAGRNFSDIAYSPQDTNMLLTAYGESNVVVSI